MKDKSKPFRFKQFEVHQDRTAMKVGTDGVILGAWTRLGKAKRILDIGSGTGLLSLMMAQRCDAEIVAVELEPSAAKQAQQNIDNSKWSNRIKLIQQDFSDFLNTEAKFDLIVSNPPFFNSKKTSTAREKARQKDSLPYSTLIQGTDKLLCKKGTFSLILPYQEMNDFLNLAESHDLHLNRVLKIKGNPSAKIKRVAMELSRVNNKSQEEILIIEQQRHQYTQGYANLLRDYLLIF